MADADKSLTVHVGTTGDPSGAKQVAGALDDVKHSTDKASDSFGEQVKKVTGLNLELGESRRIMGEIQQAMPGVAEGLRALADPFLGAVALIVGGFLKIREEIAQTTEELNKFGDLMAQRMGDLSTAHADAAREIVQRSNEVVLALDSIKEAEDRVKTGADNALSAIQKGQSALIKISDAQEAEQLAHLDAMRSQGMPAGEVAKAEAKIREDAAARRSQIEHDAAEKELAARQQELAAVQAQIEAVKAIVAKLAPNEEDRMGKLKNAPAEQATLEQQIAGIQARIDKAVENLETQIKLKETVRPDEQDIWTREHIKPAEDDLQQLIELLSKTRKALTASKDEEARFTTEQKALEDSRAEWQKLWAMWQQLDNELKNASQNLQSDDAVRGVVDALHKQADFWKTLPAIAKDAAAGLPEATSHLEAIRDLQTKIYEGIKAAAQNVGGLTANQQQINALLQEHARTIQAINQALANHGRAINNGSLNVGNF
ncbi:MAG TPA: hypothetical protein VFB72_16635 [Verrucomicrobiae bacterium]|nr:hypothetical protein [Verrucomicrobiae bacterium]